MPKLLCTIGMISLFSIAILAFAPFAAIAGDDTVLAKELYDQAKAKGQESSAAVDKMQQAFDRGDVAAGCDYVRQSQQAMQESYDLALRMTNLNLSPQNAEVARGLLSVSQRSLESGSAILELPECNEPVKSDLVDDNKFNMDSINNAAATARKIEAEGNASFADERWSVACSYLGVAQSAYANNSRLALELSRRFDAQNNSQPQLAELSAELADLEKAVIPKRDVACQNEKLGG